MKSLISSVLFFVLFISLSGCGKVPPLHFDDIDAVNAAKVDLVDNLYFVTIDNERVISEFDAAFWSGNTGATTAYIQEGSHSLFIGRKNKKNVKFGMSKVVLKKNHEYLVDYIEKQNGNYIKMHYWVVDLTKNEIIYGKRVEE